MNIASVSIPRTAQTLFVIDLIIVGVATGLFGNVAAQVGVSPILDEYANFQLIPVLWNFPAILYGTAILGTLFAMGLYQRVYMRGTGLVKSSLTAGVLTWLFAAWPMAEAGLINSDIPILEFLMLHLILFVILATIRPAVCFYYGRFAKKLRIAFVGSEAMHTVFSSAISRADPSEFVVVNNKHLNCTQEKDRLKSILLDLCSRQDIDQIVVDMPSHEFDTLRVQNEWNQLKNSHVKLVPKSTVIEQYARWSETEGAESDIAHIHKGSVARSVKFWIEILIALCGLIFVLPVMVGVAVAIKLDDGGPVFYRQKRVGKNNRVFFVLKFRSMLLDAEADGKARWAKIGDSRITRIGRFIRMTRMDELPQLINIIRGDMALVGPRPERPEMVSEIETKIPGYGLRHHVRPGLTGWAQINMSYTANLEETVRKTQLDIYYIKNWSLLIDLAIIVQTARIVLFAEGAR